METTIETELQSPSPEEAGELVSGSKDGEYNPVAIIERAQRTDRMMRRMDFRICINCEWCTHRVEFRDFSVDGLTMNKMLYCTRLERQVDQYHTCNDAHSSRSGRRKVIWDLRNSPQGFGTGYIPPDFILKKGRQNMQPDATARDGEYRGGSAYYHRKDGDKEAVGGKKIPKGLGN